MSTEPVVVAEFDKNGRGEVVRVSLTKLNAYDLLDLRVYYPDKVTGEMKPGKGLAMQQKHVGDLKKAVDAAARAIREARRKPGDLDSPDDSEPEN